MHEIIERSVTLVLIKTLALRKKAKSTKQVHPCKYAGCAYIEINIELRRYIIFFILFINVLYPFTLKNRTSNKYKRETRKGYKISHR